MGVSLDRGAANPAISGTSGVGVSNSNAFGLLAAASQHLSLHSRGRHERRRSRAILARSSTRGRLWSPSNWRHATAARSQLSGFGIHATGILVYKCGTRRVGAKVHKYTIHTQYEQSVLTRSARILTIKTTISMGGDGRAITMPSHELPDRAPGKYVPYHPHPYYSPDPLPVEPTLDIAGLERADRGGDSSRRPRGAVAGVSRRRARVAGTHFDRRYTSPTLNSETVVAVPATGCHGVARWCHHRASVGPAPGPGPAGKLTTVDTY